MDLLFRRYASPFSVCDEFIRLGQFHNFIIKLVNQDRKEKNDAELWEFYLHKVHDKSFKEFKDSLAHTNDGPVTLEMTDEQVNDVKDKARGILKGFSPQ